MSLRYKGGVISATPPTTTGGTSGTAKGVWTLEQQLQAQAAGNWPEVYIPIYIEDVFSTYLYTGTGSSNTITNNIDISGKGGLVWAKGRTNAEVHGLFDTARGANLWLSSNTTDAQTTYGGSFGVTAFNNNGFTLGTGTAVNAGTVNYVSWTFREQPKFFDVVTYVGNADTTPSRTVNHNLGSVPGCIIVKEVTQTGNWDVYHRSLGATKVLFLNLTNASSTDSLRWNDTEPTSTQFTVGSENNSQGVTYVAYLFAHNAGGFGLTGSDNVISCGSYTGDGTSDGSKFVSLGYEPQWLLIKRSNSSINGAWVIVDNMRGIVTSNSAASNDAVLEANSTAAENLDGICQLSATGFNPLGGYSNINGATYIYIAIRRGPMKTPETGTSVYGPVSYTGNNASNRNIQTGFPIDWYMFRNGTDNATNTYSSSRLQGSGTYMFTNTTASQASIGTTYFNLAQQNGIVPSTTTADFNTSGVPYMLWGFRRAPGFFDVVCYTGNSTGLTTQTLSHNLTTTPELIIIKGRSAIKQWEVQCSFGVSNYKFLRLNLTDQAYTESYNNANIYASAPTSTQFQLGGQTDTNGNTVTYVAYLFASLSGISKVGSYTGTGTTLQVNCGFTNGSRFVMIKRTDSTGDWYVWDSARGIVAGNDPYLLLNSTAAEVTNTDYVDTFSSGFEISSTAPAGINANGGTYIFLAIA